MTDKRTPDGHYEVDSKAFPEGMKALGDYVHSLGLFFGIYTSAGRLTCALRAGSLNYEVVDAQDFADWGVDYLKYDNCNNDGVPDKKRYTDMAVALNKTGRPIFYSVCNWGEKDTASWAPSISNSWRTSDDI